MYSRKPVKPSLFRKFKFLFISMASFFTLTLLSLLLFFSISSAARHHNSPKLSTPPSIAVEIRGACKASRDPPTCESALTDSGNLPSELTTPLIIQSAVKVSSQNNDKAKDMVKAIMDASTGNQNRTDAAKVCMEVLGYAEYRVGLTGQAFTRGQIKDARAWMSAVMVYQYDCWSALKYVNGTSQVSQTMAFLNSLIGYSSNALGMLVNYDIYGENTGSWTSPKTEREGFWEGSGSGGSGQVKVGVPSGLKPDVTVCKEGGCNYKTVQEAVNAAPDNQVTRKFVIWIKAGLYEEKVRVPLEKKNVVFLGDGMGKTVITGSLNVGMAGVTTYETATVGVVGDGFMASGITFQNTAGPVAHQAVAFRSDSDLSVIENCEFIGNQDTLYAHALRQYYKSCRIQGNVDFIFGNSAAFFQECDILIAPRQLNPEKGEKNAVTAHGRIDPAQSTGFVFQNCLINGTEQYMALYYKKPKVHKNYLGRPWKEYSRTVFIECTLEALILADGWLPWSGDFALKTLYYGEYRNTGAGANTAGRVPWSSQIPAEHVNSYSIQNFIQGDQWITTTS
ncbi:PREDICTED: probable pectinesterase/pectinesterase inhibitor 51 [Nicotiana attenuata]|uniref:pectinesterase n=1 Tax=Nicotiana attenuata TaxID=49451 RepID=A0A314L8M9_NICAT|nr:PREDICTED: probable pectinesterase/pectinesterase inhibitor 51 [Nicotiana attenuata]OIT37863.1 putative pectinesterasepectinesterase inhibitor 51 [Nicotiana attenuata]